MGVFTAGDYRFVIEIVQICNFHASALASSYSWDRLTGTILREQVPTLWSDPVPVTALYPGAPGSGGPNSERTSIIRAVAAKCSFMPNIASVLKDEITRLARKELKRETTSLKKASASFRSELAALKRRLAELERGLSQSRKRAAAEAPVAANDEGTAPDGRFSARSMAAQRRRLGLSAAECGLLLGTSAQSIYNWEEGKARPRAKHLAAIFAMRNLGRRQANEILETRKAA